MSNYSDAKQRQANPSLRRYSLRLPNQLQHGDRSAALVDEVSEIISIGSEATLKSGRRRVAKRPCKLCGLPHIGPNQGFDTLCCGGHLQSTHTIYAPLVKEVIELLNAVCGSCGEVFISSSMEPLVELSERMNLMQCLNPFKSRLVETATSRAKSLVEHMKENKSTHGMRSRRCIYCKADRKVTFAISITGELYMNIVSNTGDSGVRLGLMGLRSEVARINNLMTSNARELLGLYIDIQDHLVATVAGGFSGIFVDKDNSGGTKSLNNLERSEGRKQMTPKDAMEAMTDCSSRSKFHNGVNLGSGTYFHQGLERLTDHAKDMAIGGKKPRPQQSSTQRRNKYMQSGSAYASSRSNASGDGGPDAASSASAAGAAAAADASDTQTGAWSEEIHRTGSALQAMITKSKRPNSMRLLHSNNPQLIPDEENGELTTLRDPIGTVRIPERFLRGDTVKTGLPSQVEGVATASEVLEFVDEKVLLQLFDATGRLLTPPAAWATPLQRISYTGSRPLDELKSWVKAVFMGAGSSQEKLQATRAVVDGDLVMIMRTPVMDVPPLAQIEIVPDRDAAGTLRGMMCGSPHRWRALSATKLINMDGDPDNAEISMQVPDGKQLKMNGDNDGDASNIHFIPFHKQKQLIDEMKKTRLDLIRPFSCLPILGWDVPEFFGLCTGAALADDRLDLLEGVMEDASKLFQGDRNSEYLPITERGVHGKGFKLGELADTEYGKRKVLRIPEVRCDSDNMHDYQVLWQMPLAVLSVNALLFHKPERKYDEDDGEMCNWVSGYSPSPGVTGDDAAIKQSIVDHCVEYTGDWVWSADFGKLPIQSQPNHKLKTHRVFVYRDTDECVLLYVVDNDTAMKKIHNLNPDDVGMGGGLPILAHGTYIDSTCDKGHEGLSCGGADPMCARRTHSAMVTSDLLKAVRDIDREDTTKVKEQQKLKKLLLSEPYKKVVNNEYLSRCVGWCSNQGCTWFSTGMKLVYNFIYKNVTRDIIYTGGNGWTRLDKSVTLERLTSPEALRKTPQRILIRDCSTLHGVADRLLKGDLPPMGIVCFPVSTEPELNLLFKELSAILCSDDILRMFYLISRMGEAAGTNEHYHSLPARRLREDISGDGGCEYVRELAAKLFLDAEGAAAVTNRKLQLRVLTHVTPSLWSSRKVFTNVVFGVAFHEKAGTINRKRFGETGNIERVMRASRRPETDEELRRVGFAAQAIVPISESSSFNLWSILRPGRMDLVNGQVPLVAPAKRFDAKEPTDMVIVRIPELMPTWTLQIPADVLCSDTLHTHKAFTAVPDDRNSIEDQMRLFDRGLKNIPTEEFPEQHQFRGCFCRHPYQAICSKVVTPTEGNQSTRKDWLLDDVVFKEETAASLMGEKWKSNVGIYLDGEDKICEDPQRAVELYVTLCYAQSFRGLPLNMDTAMDTILGLDVIRGSSAFIERDTLLSFAKRIFHTQDWSKTPHADSYPQQKVPHKDVTFRPVFRSFMYDYSNWQSDLRGDGDVEQDLVLSFDSTYRRGVAKHVTHALGHDAVQKWHDRYHEQSDLEASADYHITTPPPLDGSSDSGANNAIHIHRGNMPSPVCVVTAVVDGILELLTMNAKLSCDRHVDRCDVAPLCVIPDSIRDDKDQSKDVACEIANLYKTYEQNVYDIRNLDCVSSVEDKTWPLHSHCISHSHFEEEFAPNLLKLAIKKQGKLGDRLWTLCVGDPDLGDQKDQNMEKKDALFELIPQELQTVIRKESVFGWNPCHPKSNKTAMRARIIPWYYQLKFGLTEDESGLELDKQDHSMSLVIRTIHSAALQAQLDAKKNPLNDGMSRSDMKLLLTRPLLIPSERNCFDMQLPKHLLPNSSRYTPKLCLDRVVLDHVEDEQRKQNEFTPKMHLFIPLSTSATLTCISIPGGLEKNQTVREVLDFPFRTLGLYMHKTIVQLNMVGSSSSSSSSSSSDLYFTSSDHAIQRDHTLGGSASDLDNIDIESDGDGGDDDVDNNDTDDDIDDDSDSDSDEDKPGDQDDQEGQDDLVDTKEEQGEEEQGEEEEQQEEEEEQQEDVDEDAEEDKQNENIRENRTTVRDQRRKKKNKKKAKDRGKPAWKATKHTLNSNTMPDGKSVSYDEVFRITESNDTGSYAFVKHPHFIIRGKHKGDVVYSTNQFQVLVEGTSKSTNNPVGVRVDGLKVIQRMKQSSNTMLRVDCLIRGEMLYVLVQSQKQRADLKTMTLGNPLMWPAATCGLIHSRTTSNEADYVVDVYDVNPIPRLVMGMQEAYRILPRHDLEYMRMYGITGQVDCTVKHLTSISKVHAIPSLLYTLFATAHSTPCVQQDDTHQLLSTGSGMKSQMYRSLVTRGRIYLPTWSGEADWEQESK
jgi:hypothetical protein